MARKDSKANRAARAAAFRLLAERFNVAAPVNAEQEAGLLAAQKLKDQGYRPHRIEEFLKGWYAKHPGPVVPSKVDANG